MSTRIDSVKEYMRMKSRKEAIEIMKAFYKKGFRYVVRDDDFLGWIQLYSEEPKKYIQEGFWGYKNGNDSNILPVKIIKNEDMTEINWNNQSAVLIETY